MDGCLDGGVERPAAEEIEMENELVNLSLLLIGKSFRHEESSAIHHFLFVLLQC